MTYKLIVPLLLCAALSAHSQTSPQKALQKVPQKAVRPAPPPPTVVLPPATPDQLVAAALAHLGGYVCELEQSLQLRQNPRHEGYVDLLIGKQVHILKPVLSSTGVLRLEDVRGRLLVLQIALKSMVLDVQSGRRMADECVHAQQAENRLTAAALPVVPGMGIDPDRAAAAAAAASAPEAAAKAVAAPASGASGASDGAVSAEPAAAPASTPASTPASAPASAPASTPAAGALPETPPPTPDAKP